MARSHERGARSEEQGSLSTVMAILLQRLQSMALLKAHDPLHRVAWLSANRAANNTVKIAAPLNPSNLHQDLIAFARLQRIIGLVCLLIVPFLALSSPLSKATAKAIAADERDSSNELSNQAAIAPQNCPLLL